MARMKPAALLAHSKRKKGVSRSRPSLCILLLIILVVGGVFLSKRRPTSGQNRKISLGGSEAGRPVTEKEASTVAVPLNASTVSHVGVPTTWAEGVQLMKTSMGDIEVELFGSSCPKTVENFVSHSINGYYDGLSFHRVIKDFMIQGGDPSGDGTGGKSIWGGAFKDEIVAELSHEAFTLSMANSGVDTNGSQFFLTTVATPWLDGKHTVFGRVVKGQEVVKAIENVAVDGNNKPIEAVLISGISIIS